MKSLEYCLDYIKKYQEKTTAYDHAMSLISYDAYTSAPAGTVENRSRTLSVLSSDVYAFSTSPEIFECLEILEQNSGSLTEEQNREVYLIGREIRDMQKIPKDEYIGYESLIVDAGATWRRAKESSDFELFRPVLEKIFETKKRFAGYLAPGTDPYDHWLGKYEEGLNREACDRFFSRLRERIVPLIRRISEKEQVDDSLRHGFFPRAKQEELSYYLMDLMKLARSHVGLSTTEHPFTTSLGSHWDTRITTHYYEDDFAASMYSVIHEGGHALYQTGISDRYAFTILDEGAAMSIHESQSRFYENIIGRSREFCGYVFPKLRELFPDKLDGKTAEDFYRAVNKAEPSLIRTEADELTYSLHVMIRYELEKSVMDGKLEVGDLPFEWNRMYREYLGIDVPDDRHGVLQDSHWSGGSIGYFPSYALGNAYGAQMYARMKENVDVSGYIRKGDFGPLNEWNREHVWQFGRLYKAQDLLTRVFGGDFDPDYYLSYLEEKYGEIYGL